MARSGLVPLFVDTSLNTHLAIAVSPNDTVASVKRIFASEHGLRFPEVGRIDIEAFITCWEGKEYCLSETMSISVVLQMEGGSFLKALVATQLPPDTEINAPLKKKRKRNIASVEDTTTLRLTESTKGGGEEFQGHGENRPSNDSYCDAKKGKSRKAERNDVAVCEAEYIKEPPLCLEKEKGIFGNKSRHDSESPEVPEGPAKKKAKNDDAKKKVVEKDIWSGSHDGGNTKKKREGDEKDIMSSCHEYNPKEADINKMAAEVHLELEVSSTCSNVLLCKELLPPCKKNLLVLDINGILVDITSDYRYQQYADFKISGKLGFKRPFCVDFLKFCFANFEVGVWSSRKQHNLEEAVYHLFGEMQNKLLFCWDQSKCTDTKFKTVENKPLFFKELNKLWEKVEADLPWEKGRFTPSNTLLVDDSPCKALRNPCTWVLTETIKAYLEEIDKYKGKLIVKEGARAVLTAIYAYGIQTKGNFFLSWNWCVVPLLLSSLTDSTLLPQSLTSSPLSARSLKPSIMSQSQTHENSDVAVESESGSTIAKRSRNFFIILV